MRILHDAELAKLDAKELAAYKAELAKLDAEQLATAIEDRREEDEDTELAELAGTKQADKKEHKDEKYVGKYIKTKAANSLCRKLGIAEDTGGTAIFLAMLAKIMSAK